MQTLYNIGVFLYGFALRVTSLFNPKAKLWVKGRRNLYRDLPIIDNKELIWFHCASLGEFDQGLPLMKKIKESNSAVFILVTFFSPSGMEHYHKRDHNADHVMYLPLDTKSNAREFFSFFKPTKAFFVKYEFWTNFILEAKKNGTKLYNVSGIFRPNHRFFKWYGAYFRDTLRAFDWFFVQNKTSLELLNSINIVNVSIAGDSRYDRVLEVKNNVTENDKISVFCQGEKVFIAGSTWPEDEKILVPLMKKEDVKSIIAPHNINESNIKSILQKLPEAIRYTAANELELKNASILILDTIGQLSNAYFYGKIAYVGGGFSGNLHNILEPAVFGIPVIFGPKHSRFPEAQSFIDAGIGSTVKTSDELIKSYGYISNNISDLSTKTSQFVEEHKGVADKIILRITAS